MTFFILIIDGTDADRADAAPGHVLLLKDLALDAGEIEPMIVMYSVMELATAVKPALLQALLGRGFDAVAYFDPDIWVISELGDIFAKATDSGIVLTPHSLAPIARDGFEISERTIMHAGIFNLGFIAVGAGAAKFLEWWHERMFTDAVVDFENALFTDQRWIDWVPALFDHVVLRDPGCNVAYWNVHERRLTQEADGSLLAGGSLLRFFHFSGFDTESPWLLSRFMGEQPRVLLSEHPLLRDLCATYAEALEGHQHQRQRQSPYGFNSLQNGPVLTPEVRRLYREAITNVVPLTRPPMNPVSDPESLARWLVTPVQCAPWAQFAPADIALWRSRSDLRARFPSLFGAASLYFRHWLDVDPSVSRFYRELGLGSPKVAQVGGSTVIRRRFGWSVAASAAPEASGDAREVARRVMWAVARAGFSAELVEPARETSRAAHLWVHSGAGANLTHDNVIVCLSAESFSEDRIVQALADRRGRSIGLWMSPYARISANEIAVLNTFDELWVLDEATEESLAAETTRPVTRVRLPWIDHEHLDSAHADVKWLSEFRGAGPVFLVPLDARSDFAEQNVVLAITAFKRAFSPEDDARLIIFVQSGDLTRRQREELHHAQDGRHDIAIRSDVPDSITAPALVPWVDCVVSLHRAIAFSSTVASAVERGTPVVLTGLPGRTMSLDESCALLVPFALVAGRSQSATKNGEFPVMWAEPDLAAATRALRTVADDPELVAAMAARARSTTGHGSRMVDDVMRQYLLGSGNEESEVRYREVEPCLQLDVTERGIGAFMEDRAASADSADGLNAERLATAVQAARAAHELVENLGGELEERRAEVLSLRTEIARLEAEISALHETKLFRYTAGLRRLHGARRRR